MYDQRTENASLDASERRSYSHNINLSRDSYETTQMLGCKFAKLCMNQEGGVEVPAWCFCRVGNLRNDSSNGNEYTYHGLVSNSTTGGNPAKSHNRAGLYVTDDSARNRASLRNDEEL